MRPLRTAGALTGASALVASTLVASLMVLPTAAHSPLSATGTIGTAAAVRGPAPMTEVRVVSANLREGSRLRRESDMRNGDDRASFVRRLFASGKAPDVVLLQEVLGSAASVVRTLNRHPATARSDARYALAVGPRRDFGRGPCDGPRARRYKIVRDSAIVVNLDTVRAVRQRGVVGTWGSWFGERGCAEQPWALVEVQHRGSAPSVARVGGLHVAPTNARLKTRAVVHTAQRLARMHRSTPSAMLVLGGDLNLTRCVGTARRAETAGCPLRLAHRHLAQQGFRDAVRSQHLGGAEGVVGVRHRIDFIYTTSGVRRSWFDRCYKAYNVARHSCRPQQSTFASPPAFHRCEYRATILGYPGGECARSRYLRYYSDHPIVRAALG